MTLIWSVKIPAWRVERSFPRSSRLRQVHRSAGLRASRGSGYLATAIRSIRKKPGGWTCLLQSIHESNCIFPLLLPRQCHELARPEARPTDFWPATCPELFSVDFLHSIAAPIGSAFGSGGSIFRRIDSQADRVFFFAESRKF